MRWGTVPQVASVGVLHPLPACSPMLRTCCTVCATGCVLAPWGTMTRARRVEVFRGATGPARAPAEVKMRTTGCVLAPRATTVTPRSSRIVAMGPPLPAQHTLWRVFLRAGPVVCCWLRFNAGRAGALLNPNLLKQPGALKSHSTSTEMPRDVASWRLPLPCCQPGLC